MVRCAICKQTSEETKLFEGIFKTEMINICKECAEQEEIPIIQKPSETQLNKADERYTVRERMEIMSGMRDTTEISEDQTLTQGNLAKLRIPPKKQFHEDVLDNYYWTLNIARRRKKLTINQLANQTQIAPETIQEIEKGKIPEDFEKIFMTLELYLDIKLLKNHKKQVHFLHPSKEQAEEILKEVREKMDPSLKPTNQPDIEIKQQQLDKLSKGEIDFSKRDDLSDITLNDLVEMKKQKEHKKSTQKSKAQEESLIGDDLELDTDEL